MAPASSAARANLPLKVRRRLIGHKGPVHAVRFNSKGTYCMTAGQDKSVKLWNPFRSNEDDLSRGLLVQTYTGPHGYELKDVAATEDSSRFVSAGADKPFFLWDVATARVIRRFAGHEAAVNSVAFNPDGSVVVSGSYDKTVRLWDVRSNNRDPIQVLSEARDSVTRVVVTSDEILTASVDGCLRSYDLRSGIVNVDSCHEPLSSLALSYDGKCVLLSGLDGVIRLLERATGEMLNSYRGHANTSYPVESRFDNTDAYIFSGSEDGCMYVYDLVGGKVVAKPREHARAVCSLAYHPKEPHVVTVSYDGHGCVWGGASGDD